MKVNMQERITKLDTYREAIEALERLIKNSYDWEIENIYDNGEGIEEWEEYRKNQYSMLMLRKATIQCLINEIAEKKV